MTTRRTRRRRSARGSVFGAYSALSMVVAPLGLGGMAAVLAWADLRVGARELATEAGHG